MNVHSNTLRLNLLFVAILFFLIASWALFASNTASMAALGSAPEIPQAPPRSLSYVSKYDGGSEAYSVALQGNYAYVGFDWTLKIVNIANPASPSQAGQVNLNGSAEDIAVWGSYAYVANTSNYGLLIVDISSPSIADIVGGAVMANGLAQGVISCHTNYFVCVTDANNKKLRVYDVGTPYAPEQVGSYDYLSNPQGLFISGSNIYVADSGEGLRTFSISFPGNPSGLGSYNTPGTAYDVAVSGNYAYVADGESGLRVIDISNPGVPDEVGACDTPGDARSVAVSGDYAFIADGSSGVRVIDISDPEHPQETGFYDTDGNAQGVAVSGNYVYVADGSGDLLILQMYEPTITPTPTQTDTPTVTATPSPTPTATPTPISVYLPLAWNDYFNYFKGPWEIEPNNDYRQANGPLLFGQEYYGYPNDAKDYFSLYLSESGDLTIDLTSFLASGAQMLLYYQVPVANGEVQRVFETPYHIEYNGAAAGWYYIFVYASGGYNSSNPYTLQTTFTPAVNLSALALSQITSVPIARVPNALLNPTPPIP